MSNPFCRTSTTSGFPKWSIWDLGLWYVLPDNERLIYTGEPRSLAYKLAYIQFNKDILIHHAQLENIPVLLLAGVAFNEVGGMPENSKAYGVLQIYQLVDFIKRDGNKTANATSVGSLAIQLRAAAETLGIEPGSLTTTQQLQLANCLLDDDFNISIVAKHLKSLILFDNPDLEDTSILSEQQLVIAGARYNRGIERKKEDFITSISVDALPEVRNYSSYGRTILRRQSIILKALGMQE